MFDRAYSELYDSFNESKDYPSEVDFVCGLLGKYSNLDKVRSLLDLGCGSGKHLEAALVRLPSLKQAIGVDASESLCLLAEKRLSKKANVIRSSIVEFSNKAKFDLIWSLFHVVNYHTTSDQLFGFMNTLKRHLELDGTAILDFWNLSAWRSSPPAIRKRKVEYQGKVFQRVSVPTVDYLRGIAEIEFSLQDIGDSGLYFREQQKEVHRVRALTVLELEMACHSSGLKIEALGPWLVPNKALAADDWYGYAIIRHKQ